jgi:uncharacterized protein (DUF2062 family)
VAHECDVDFTGYARQAQSIYERMAERCRSPKISMSDLLVALTIGTEIALSPTPVRSVIAIIVAIVIAGERSRIAVPGRVVVNNGSGLLIGSWW